MALADGLVMYHKFEEASGIRADAMVLAKHPATPTNAPGSIMGMLGNALNLVAASAQYLTVADHPDLRPGQGSFTIALWYYRVLAGPTQPILSKFTTPHLEYMLFDAGGTLTFFYSLDGTTFSSHTLAGVFNETGWYHLVMWYDHVADQLGLSINTTSATKAYAGGFHEPTPLTPGAPFYIGRHGDVASFCQGRLDELGFWDRPLTGAERVALYNSRMGITYPFSDPHVTEGLYVSTDGVGVDHYTYRSIHVLGESHGLRVLKPTTPATNQLRRFVYILPVKTETDVSDFGDPIDQIRINNLHNLYNLVCIAPEFRYDPWLGNHPTDLSLQYESFLVQLPQWVREHLSTTYQEEHWLCGFSKSGYSAIHTMFRWPNLFDAVIAWDSPITTLPTTIDWITLSPYATQANVDTNYRILTLLASWAPPFVANARKRLWISVDTGNYRTDMLAFQSALTVQGIPYLIDPTNASRTHRWDTGWMPIGFKAMVETMPLVSPLTVGFHVNFGTSVLDLNEG